MRYGKFLPEKGTIGFVAPSFGCNIEPYRRYGNNKAMDLVLVRMLMRVVELESVTLRKSVQKNLMTGMLRKM